jgi:hypothetical protein
MRSGYVERKMPPVANAGNDPQPTKRVSRTAVTTAVCGTKLAVWAAEQLVRYRSNSRHSP